MRIKGLLGEVVAGLDEVVGTSVLVGEVLIGVDEAGLLEEEEGLLEVEEGLLGVDEELGETGLLLVLEVVGTTTGVELLWIEVVVLVTTLEEDPPLQGWVDSRSTAT